VPRQREPRDLVRQRAQLGHLPAHRGDLAPQLRDTLPVRVLDAPEVVRGEYADRPLQLGSVLEREPQPHVVQQVAGREQQQGDARGEQRERGARHGRRVHRTQRSGQPHQRHRRSLRDRGPMRA
jgi:hypothetical protein